MTTLKIKLHQPWARGYMECGAVLSVRKLADASGSAKTEWWTQEKAASIVGESGERELFTTFELPGAGYYGVGVTRPRGNAIQQEYMVKEGEVRTETITLPASSHEYLAWEQYAEVLRPAPEPARAEYPQPLPPGGYHRFYALRSEQESHKARLIGKRQDFVDLFRAELPESAQAWDMLRERIGFIRKDRLSWTPMTDDEFAVWLPRIPRSQEGWELIQRLKEPRVPNEELETRYPRWIEVAAGPNSDLASLPWAWWGADPEPDEELRLVYDLVKPSSVAREEPGRLVVSVQDHRWFGLLEFLSSGRLAVAGAVADEVAGSGEAGEAIYGKRKGPLVATAGAIVLIARAVSSEQQSWDPWLDNLSNWFPRIPDGPILLGYRRMQQATTKEELNSAHGRLREGIGRGIPFFSATIRMLSLALAQIGTDEADADLRRVSSIASRVDPEQPFTVIRL